MAEQVRAGEIIHADLFNFVLSKLEELEGRVGDLESGTDETSQVQITGFNPANQVEAGQLLEIFGVNFAFPPEGNDVTIDKVPVPDEDFMSGSTSMKLRLIVPESIEAPEEGRNVTIRIENEFGSTEVRYRILPAIPVVGDPPEITDIYNFADENPTLQIGEEAAIEGENFAVEPTDNRVTFRYRDDDGTESVYGPDGLNINEDESTESLIVVEVPDIAEITGTFEPEPVTVEVSVGAHPPTADTADIMRT